MITQMVVAGISSMMTSSIQISILMVIEENYCPKIMGKHLINQNVDAKLKKGT